MADARVDDPTQDTLADFTGSLRLPGTNAALRVGGYVKATLVNSLDPLVISDRFIVGSVPVNDTRAALTQSTLTASQSRLSFDLREATELGVLRAYIEGDFAADSDTFRLRHAFGQWRRVLAGKTWSAFVDTQASPEEVDFEGLNGRVNVRQSQIRVMPRIGEQFEFQLSLEDPEPLVANTEPVNRWPDVILSGRLNWNERLHMKLGLLSRQIRVRSLITSGSTQKKTGWGVTLSGRLKTPLLDERDSLLFQINGGSGIGRYINDLASVGELMG